MTGSQVSPSAEKNAVAAQSLAQLSGDEWKDDEVIRSFAAAIPPGQRKEALAALLAIIGGETSDTFKGTFNA